MYLSDELHLFVVQNVVNKLKVIRFVNAKENKYKIAGLNTKIRNGGD